MASSAEELLEMRDDMHNDRNTFDALYDDVSRFIFPQRARVDAQQAPGEDRTNEIHDSTATHSALIAASATQGAITPSTAKWFNMRLNFRDLEDIEGVKEWLHELSMLTWKSITISNFNTEGQEVFLDLYGYGMGNVFVGQRSPRLAKPGAFRGFHFKSTQPGFYVVAENEDGIVDTIFRDFKITAAAAARMFGRDNLPQCISERLEKGKPYDLVEITHHVAPRLEIDPLNVAPDAPAHLMPYRSVYLVREDASVLHEGGYFEFPYMAPRWYKMSGEIYGRGPGINALPDIRTVNRAMELHFGAWEKAVDPPMAAMHRAVLGNIDIRARGLTILKQKDALSPIHQGIRHDVDMNNLEERREQIRRAFFIDQIQLPPMGGTPASATEIAGRFETMQRILGPTFGRIQYEMFNPMLSFMASTLIREGVAPPPPEGLLEALREEGLELEFEYEGPLSRAAQFQDVENIQRIGVILASLSEVYPEVLDYFDAGEAGKAILDASSLPPQIIRSEQEVEEMKERRGEAQEGQATTGQAVAASQAIKNVAPFLQEGGVQPTI